MIGLPDRPVPKDMNFSEWKIENFEMQNDLAFGTARIRFTDARVALDFTFEGSHPPYAYGGNALGCPGYAARDLWQDRTVIPVRGQTGWLVPQPEANYAVRMGTLSALSKADGIVVMNNNPDIGDMLGVGDSTELPVRAPIEEAMAALAGVFAPRSNPGAPA